MATNHQPFSHISGYSSFKPLGNGGFGSIFSTATPKTLVAGANITLTETPTTTTIASTSTGSSELALLTDVSLQQPLTNGEVLTWNSTENKWKNENPGAQVPTSYVSLSDVAIAPTPIAGAVTLYDAPSAKWVQSAAIKHNATGDDKLALETTGDVAILGGGAVGIQSTGGEIAIASSGDASLTSALGNTNITSLTNSVQITSAIDTIVTSSGGVTVQASNDISISTSGTGKTATFGANGIQGSVIIDAEEIIASNLAKTINMTGSGVCTFRGYGSTEIGIEDGGSVTNLRGDEINIVMPQTGCSFIPQGPFSESVVEVDTDNISAVDYATRISTKPNALATVEYVTSQISGNDATDLKIGGNAPASTLIFGTTNAQELQMIKNGIPVMETSAGGAVSLVAPSTVTLNGQNVVIRSSVLTQFENSTATPTVGIYDNGEVKSLLGGYTALVTAGGENVLTNKEYVNDYTTTSLETQAVVMDNKSLVDDTTHFIGDLDPTKRVKFQVDGLTTNTTREIAFPDASGTLVLNTTAIVQGGNTFGQAMSIGPNDNFDFIVRRLGLPAYTFTNLGITIHGSGTTQNLTYAIRAPTTDYNGSLLFVAGTNTTATGTNTPLDGGSVSFTTGTGRIQASQSAVGGSFNVSLGKGVRTRGGDFNVTAGLCDASSVSTGRGGQVLLRSGSCQNGGKSGDIIIQATTSTTTDVDPGNIFIQCPPLTGTGARVGGIITIQASSGSSGGANGYIRLLHNATTGFTIEGNGTLSTNTVAYENLITLDNDIPNRKYVMDLAIPFAEVVYGGVDPIPATPYQYTYTAANTWYEMLPPTATLDSNNSLFLVSGAKFTTSGGGRIQWLGPSSTKARFSISLNLSISGGNADDYDFMLSRTDMTVPATPVIVPISGTLVRERMIANATYQVMNFSKMLTLTTNDHISIIARSSGNGRVMSVAYFGVSVSTDQQYR